MTLGKASDELANHIGNWLSDQIALGATPLELHDGLVRALGIGLRMFAEVSADPDKVGEAIGLSAKAIVLYAHAAKVEAHVLQEH